MVTLFQAEMWNIDTVTKEYGSGPLMPSEVSVGLLTIDSHSKVCTRATSMLVSKKNFISET